MCYFLMGLWLVLLCDCGISWSNSLLCELWPLCELLILRYFSLIVISSSLDAFSPVFMFRGPVDTDTDIDQQVKNTAPRISTIFVNLFNVVT